MKKRLIATVLSLVLTLSMSFTALAASSNTDSNSGDQGGTTTSAPAPSVATPSNPKPVAAVVAETKAGETIETAAIQVAVEVNGTATAVTLDKVVDQKEQEVVQTVASIAAITANVAPTASAAEQAQAAAQVVAQVSALLTQAPSPQFQETVKALAVMKGADVAVNNCGTVKTAAVAKDALGNTIASAGRVSHVTSGALIMLMSVNADGTIEYVEGIVDPVTGEIIGAFQGTPAVITVLVLA